jgi:dihydroorotate dehydrogenase (fumarate)
MTSRITCKYMSLSLNSPVVVGACPLTLEPEKLRQMIIAGAGAVVLPSLFQEQLSPQCELPLDPLIAAEVAAQDTRQQIYNGGPDQYLTSIREIKRLVTLPVIGSLNGYSVGPWLDFAQQIQASGANALELNLQPVISDPQQPAEEVENGIAEIVRQVCQCVTIPVAVKTTRHFTNLPRMLQLLRSAGAAGVVLFAHEAHWDVAIRHLRWTVNWELTPVNSIGTTIAGIIHAKPGAAGLSVAASGGVCNAEDAIKAFIAGADVVMVTSEIYRSGPSAISGIVQGIERYLDANGFATLTDLLNARPTPQIRGQQTQRRDYLDPLTASKKYHDPTPVIQPQTGDQYGHQD